MTDVAEQIAAIIDPPAWSGRERRSDKHRRTSTLKKAQKIMEVLPAHPDHIGDAIGCTQTRSSIIAMIETEAAKRRGRGIKRLADILTGAIAARFDEKDAEDAA